MFCARLFICALWSPAGKGLTSWLSFVVSSVSLSLSHWYPGSDVVLDCIDSWSLHHYLLGWGSGPFLAHQIRISEILPWDRKFYLTHAILPRLSREGYIHWMYWNSRTWSSNDVIVMLKWRHHVQYCILAIQGLLEAYFKIKKQWWARKESIIRVRVG